MDISTKDAIVILKFRGFKNGDISRQLNVSRQYVSRICCSFQEAPIRAMGSAQATKKGGWESSNNEIVSVGIASRLLGVSPATVRRWSDTGQIPSYRLEVGRKDRKFKATELQQLIVGSGLESVNSSG